MKIEDYTYPDGDIQFRTIRKQGMGKPKPQHQCKTDSTDWTPLKNCFQGQDETNTNLVVSALMDLGSCDEAFDLLAKRRG